MSYLLLYFRCESVLDSAFDRYTIFVPYVCANRQFYIYLLQGHHYTKAGLWAHYLDLEQICIPMHENYDHVASEFCTCHDNSALLWNVENCDRIWSFDKVFARRIYVGFHVKAHKPFVKWVPGFHFRKPCVKASHQVSPNAKRKIDLRISLSLWNAALFSTSMQQEYVSKFSVTLTHWPLGDLNAILKMQIFILVLLIGIFISSHDNALRWMPQDLTDDQSTLIQVMAWCPQATGHYLNQCWPISLPPFAVTRPQWVKHLNPILLLRYSLASE